MLPDTVNYQCRTRGQKMKENNSVNDKMIDRNWVLKRKRRRVPYGPDQSNGKAGDSVPSESSRNLLPAKRRLKSDIHSGQDRSNAKEGNSAPPESPRNHPHAKRRLKSDIISDRSSYKKKGNDGYYFECVICDLGGNLLCCDSCPQTYHLQCLNPPLKRTPPGRWQCPNCCERNDSVKPVNHPESILRRARTKITAEKSKMGTKSSNPHKVSQILESLVPAKSRSSSKARSSFSHSVPSLEKKSDSSQTDVFCSTKSCHSSQGGPGEAISSCGNADTEKKHSLCCAGESVDKKLHSPANEVQSSGRVIDSEPNGEPAEKKSDSLCIDGNKLMLTSGHATQKTRKKKKKVDKEDNNNKTRTDKGKSAVKASRKLESKSISAGPETSKLRQKYSSGNNRVSISMLKEDLGTKSSVVQQQDKRSPEVISTSVHAFDETRGQEDKMVTSDENVPSEVQQVDRILGCRVQSSEKVSPCFSQPIKFSASPGTHHATSGNNCTRAANDLPSKHLPVLEKCDRVSEDEPSNSNVVDVENADLLAEGCHNSVNPVDKRKSIKNDTKVDKIHVYKRCAKEGSGEGNATVSVRRSFKLQSFMVSSTEGLNGSAVGREDTEKITKKAVPEENAGVECVSLDVDGNCPMPKACKTPVFPDANGTKDEDKEMRLNDSVENKTQESVLEESAPSHTDTVLYEFLVKWVGQSHIHNSWVPEAQLKVLAKRKLENYKSKYGTALINLCEEQWCQLQRVIALRSCKDGTSEAFVKWCGLHYDECTWEKLDESAIGNSLHMITEFKHFEFQTLAKDSAKDDFLRSKCQHTDIVALEEQPKELKGGSLFPHQLEALNWLRKCWHKSKNVILADEMGLGKTVSACAFISSLYFEFKVRLPCLVLVPLSTMPNWLAEFALWAPDLNVVEYHGCAKARSIIRQYEWHAHDPNVLNKRTKSYKFNVLLTTYEMVLADSSHLRGVPWEVLVVDEGHRLKNSGSKLFSLLNTFSFQHRVLLTGTPLQNNIGEMYNLLNFLQPTSFPSLSSFEERFNDLTTAEKVEELKKLVAPHMLRRLKKDAMQNIPPKTERMVPVELSSIQSEYYRAMLTKNYQILRNIGKGVAQKSMLNIVMQLRKVCNHPYLISGTEPDSGSVEFLQEMRIKASAKLTLLHSMLKVLHREGHRVLIFSQMTKLLDILEDYLTIEYGPKTFERVDGSVSVADRQAAITRFNQDSSRFVFLLSTRSCGLGINLATADTVIIYDSDFNPHADIQAMNRAHRIGQSKRLLVYRLVVRASVEERILQLAKKKLMLDQLFVNKSGSQKEVEDILRWGTEELFNDSAGVAGKDTVENSSNKDETTTDTEHKHKRRPGGLGDVYKDRCTDGSTKIIWDENAILKLLDRSNLQSGSSESTEGDLENDMLGSVKSVEWNDEATEEQIGTEFPPAVSGDVCAQGSEQKEESAVGVTEENEWDRLLRVRWEKYQIEEEESLGRGKRLRKAVSYREAFASHLSENLSESGNEEEEQVPEPEYTPAGRALKAKFAKLRARQKERLAQRNITDGSHYIEGQLGPESLPPFPTTDAKGGEQSVGPASKQALAIDLENDKFDQSSDASKNKGDSTLGLGKPPKPGLDLSVRPLGPLASDVFLHSPQLQRTSYSNSVPTSNLLPVLGLCAPNANQRDSIHSSLHSYSLPRSNCGQSSVSLGFPEFPFHLAPGAGSSINMDIKDRESVADAYSLPDSCSDGSQCRAKSTIPDYFPFNPYPPATTQGRGPDPVSITDSSFSAFQEKMARPNLAVNENRLPKFSLPVQNVPRSHPDFLPNLSLGMRNEALNDSLQDLPAMRLLPNLRLPPEDPRYNPQSREVPPTLTLGQVQPLYSSLPENHKKVLDNIMMRTGSGSNKLFKKRLKIDTWSEDELDALWIGVRRHGRGNWDAMLRDSKLKFSKFRTSEDLSAKWEEEQRKIFDGTGLPVSKAGKATKSTEFPGISDGMMVRALHGSRLSSLGTDRCPPTKFRTHLTDMQLSYGDLSSVPNEHNALLPPWKPDKFRPDFIGDIPAGPSDRPGTSSNLHSEHPFMLNSFANRSLSAHAVNCSSSCEFKQKEDEQGANKYSKLPSFLDRSLNLLRDSHNHMHGGESTSTRVLPEPNKQLSSSSAAKNDTAGTSSMTSKLPHWLREAVSVPARPPEPDLPPTVSAIAHSVRLLYGEEKLTIPPFTVPGPPPSQPRDPRRSLKKEKRRLRKLKRMTPDIAESSKKFQTSLLGDNVASSSVPLVPPFPMPLQPPSMPGTSGFPWSEPDLNLPPLNLDLMSSPPSSSSYINHRKKIGKGLSPSPEVLHLVASCVAPGPQLPPVPGMERGSFLRSEMPLPKVPDAVGEGGSSELKGVHEKSKAVQSILFPPWSEVPKDITDRTESGDSSKTHSDPCNIDRPEGEISSEETVSDNHGSEREP
ncbi:protein CHROMATIN REMODELING 4-like isoform X2 [Telopea speciosissima]|uniref:protein CHROMATIN REMODELING 4-like isoform X2 n=1 Tax=Telopea speciosissima TaxID=54955 RepID=UPI001CC78C77|nr:protein CHROMATIN REMODELING 4-like isoform X2 [Telopea speciosissima]